MLILILRVQLIEYHDKYNFKTPYVDINLTCSID